MKWVRNGVAEARIERWRLGAELAALRFLSDDLGLALAPRVLAADPAAGFVVLEDLAPRVALDCLICRDGAAAHLERLAVFARVLGELGAVTAGRVEVYSARWSAMGQRWLATVWDHVCEDAAALGVPLSGPAASEIAAALDELQTPGPFLALSNGDAESNNILVR